MLDDVIVQKLPQIMIEVIATGAQRLRLATQPSLFAVKWRVRVNELGTLAQRLCNTRSGLD